MKSPILINDLMVLSIEKKMSGQFMDILLAVIDGFLLLWRHEDWSFYFENNIL